MNQMRRGSRESSNKENEIESLIHKLYYDLKQSTDFTSAEKDNREADWMQNSVTRDTLPTKKGINYTVFTIYETPHVTQG